MTLIRISKYSERMSLLQTLTKLKLAAGTMIGVLEPGKIRKEEYCIYSSFHTSNSRYQCLFWLFFSNFDQKVILYNAYSLIVNRGKGDV